MNSLTGIAKMLIFTGIILCSLGILLWVLGKIGISGWRLPGDIFVKKENYSFYFPLGTCILLSLILTLILQIFRR